MSSIQKPESWWTLRRKGDNEAPPTVPIVLPKPGGSSEESVDSDSPRDFYSGSITESMDRLRRSIDSLTDAINDLGQQSSGEHRKGL